MHLVDEKSRGNFKKSGYFAFGCFCLFLLEPVDAKTPDIYCIYVIVYIYLFVCYELIEETGRYPG